MVYYLLNLTILTEAKDFFLSEYGTIFTEY